MSSSLPSHQGLLWCCLPLLPIQPLWASFSSLVQLSGSCFFVIMLCFYLVPWVLLLRSSHNQVTWSTSPPKHCFASELPLDVCFISTIIQNSISDQPLLIMMYFVTIFTHSHSTHWYKQLSGIVRHHKFISFDKWSYHGCSDLKQPPCIRSWWKKGRMNNIRSV